MTADERRGLALWGTAGRWLFLNWPRGSWQYDLICGAIIAGLFVLPGPRAQGPLDLDGVLAAIEAADAEVDSYTARSVETIHAALFDTTDVEVGELRVLEPDHVRRDIVEPAPRTELVSGGEARIYLPRAKKVDVYTLESERGRELVIPGMSSSEELRGAYEISLVEVLEGDQVPTASAEGPAAALPAEDGRVYVLELLPRADNELGRRWERIRMWVVEGQWHPARRIVLIEHAGDSRTMDLLEVDREADLDEDDFELDLPADVRIVYQDRGGRPDATPATAGAPLR